MKMTLITQDKDKKCKVAIERWFHPEGEIGYLKSLSAPSVFVSGTIISAFGRPITVGYTIDEEYWDARVHTTKENPKQISLNPDKPIYIGFVKDVIWLDFGKPFSVCYVESTPDGKINWDKRLNFSGNPTEDPLFTCSDGMFMWGLNYDKRKNGAVLICDPSDRNKVIGKIVFVHSDN